MKKLKVFSISAILIAICCSFLFSASVSAASKKRNKFDHKPSGNIYYYDENGHTVKGLVTIRGKKYYFNEKGIQQNGWQKIKGDYYFFQIRNGCYASMVTSRRVNGIYLTKSGEARYNSEEKRKLNLMVTANQVMRRVTKRNMSKPEKLWRCYLKAVSYGYGGTGNDYDFRYYYSNWDVSYAEDMFYRGHGDCFDLHLHLLTWLSQSDLKPRLSHQAVMDGLRSKEKSAIRTGQKAQDISKDITV